MDSLRTVKEVSERTGISVRTLHYYDEIGLLRPTAFSEAGYRLYDDRALETLQQILFFREFEIPLKGIRAMIEQPDFDRNEALKNQWEMLRLKKERLERLMASIEEILKGENRMDFTVFDKKEIEELADSMMEKMDEGQKEFFREQYGSMERFRDHFLREAESEKAQKNFAKVVEWYGSKTGAMQAAKNGPAGEGRQILQAYQERMDSIHKRLAEKKAAGIEASALEVKQLIGEYDFVTKQLYRLPDAKKMLCDMAKLYRTDPAVAEAMDVQYGEGVCRYIGQALEEFYKE